MFLKVIVGEVELKKVSSFEVERKRFIKKIIKVINFFLFKVKNL